jgi:N-sulfoglucosamine sulfohydrolase
MMGSNRHFLISFLLVVVAADSSANGQADPSLAIPVARPNILFITIDDLGWDSIGIYGSNVPDITPNIDRLAREGLRFDHAHVNVSICQPSRAAFMTGRLPHRSGAMGFEQIRPDVTTVAERLREAGYFLGIMSKVNHTTPSRRSVWHEVVEESDLNAGRSPTAYYEHANAFFRAARSARRPFFLVVNINDPHLPFPGTPLEDAFMRQGKAGFSSLRPPVTRSIHAGEATIPGFLPDHPAVRESIAAYLTGVHRADESVGRLLASLAEAGFAEDTLVMLVSDNGMHFPFAKTNVYNASTKTPWIVRWPGVTKPGSLDADHVISAIDYTPTVLEVAGAPPLDDIDGRSFVSVLKGEPQNDRDFAFTFLYQTLDGGRFPMRSIVGRRYAYIYNAWSNGTTAFRNRTEHGVAMRAMVDAAKEDDALAARLAFLRYRMPEELYDYASDPDALHNLIDEADLESIVAGYRERLRGEMKRSHDPLLNRFQAWIQDHPLSGIPAPGR